MAALNEPGSQNNTPKELELASSIHKNALEDLREQYQEIIKSFERQIADAKNLNNELETKVTELQVDQEALDRVYKGKLEEVDQKLKEAEEKVKAVSEEKKKVKEAMELDTQVKVLNLNSAMEKMKQDHTKELDQMKQKCEISLEDIKYIYQQERISLERRLEKMQSELKLATSNKDTNSTQSQIQDLQTSYIEEIQELNSHLKAFQKQSQEEVQSLTKERDAGVIKSKELQTELTRVKEAYTALQGLYQKAKASLDANEGIQAELKKCKMQITDMKAHIAKLEGSERRLKVMLANKESAFESEKETMKRKFSAERKKATQAHDGYSRAKDECDKKLTQVLQDIIAKDHMISQLTKQLEIVRKEEMKNQSQSKTFEISAIRSVCEEVKDVSKDFSKDLSSNNTKDDLLSSATRVECKKCGCLCLVEEFAEHIEKDCETCCDKVGNEGEAMIMAQSQCVKGKPNRTMTAVIAQPPPEKEKSLIGLMKKLKMTEELLKEMAFKLDTVQQQRDKVQIELDKANAELLSMKIRHPEEFSHTSSCSKRQMVAEQSEKPPIKAPSKENEMSIDLEKSIRQSRSISIVNSAIETSSVQNSSGKKSHMMCKFSNNGNSTTVFNERKNVLIKNTPGSINRAKMCFSPSSSNKKKSKLVDEDTIMTSPGENVKQLPRASFQHSTNFQ